MRLFAFRYIFVWLVAWTPFVVHAQEDLRPSVAGERSAASRRPDVTQYDYNLKIGAIRFKLDASLRTEFSDNVLLQDENAESDLLIEPRLTLNAIWPITRLNTLRLAVGVGYTKHLSHPELDGNAITIAPGSSLSFDIFIRDFRINLHDSFSLQEDPVTQGTLSNTGRFGRFENTIGTTVWWDLNAVVLSLTYDHSNLLSTGSQGSASTVSDSFDRSLETVSGSAYFPINQSTGGGLEGSASYVTYTSTDSKTKNYSAGIFGESLITPYLRFRAAIGIQSVDTSSTVQFIDLQRSNANPLLLTPVIGTHTESSSNASFYGNVTIQNRLSNYYTHSLSLGHEIQLGLSTDNIETNFIRYASDWRVNRLITLNTQIYYEEGTQHGAFDESYSRFGAGVGFGYQLTKKLGVGIQYSVTKKDSDLVGRDYLQNRLGIDFRYSF